MAKILFLPGKSTRNKTLVEEANELLGDHELETIEYEHWEDKELDISRIEEKIYFDDETIVIGKSMGAWLALKQDYKAKRYILMGFPIKPFLKEEKQPPEIKEKEVVFIQNEDDRVGTPEELKKAYTHATIIKNDRDDHTYSIKDVLKNDLI